MKNGRSARPSLRLEGLHWLPDLVPADAVGVSAGKLQVGLAGHQAVVLGLGHHHHHHHQADNCQHVIRGGQSSGLR